MRILIVFLILTVVYATGYSQSEKKRVRQGNTEYEDGNYQEAEKEYRKALMEKPGYTKGTFNLGDAMYEQENFEESAKLYTEIIERNTSKEEKAASFYNLGNTLMKGQKYQESIDAFKNSLRMVPGNNDAMYNLEYARKKLQEQQQQQQDQDQNKDQENKDKDQQDKENKDQENKDNKDKQDQDKKQDEQKDQDKKDQDKGDQQKDQQKQQQPQKISKQDAKKMLEALKNDEKKTLQKLQKEKAKAAKGAKSDIDW